MCFRNYVYVCLVSLLARWCLCSTWFQNRFQPIVSKKQLARCRSHIVNIYLYGRDSEQFAVRMRSNKKHRTEEANLEAQRRFQPTVSKQQVAQSGIHMDNSDSYGHDSEQLAVRMRSKKKHRKEEANNSGAKLYAPKSIPAHGVVKASRSEPQSCG